MPDGWTLIAVGFVLVLVSLLVRALSQPHTRSEVVVLVVLVGVIGFAGYVVAGLGVVLEGSRLFFQARDARPDRSRPE